MPGAGTHRRAAASALLLLLGAVPLSCGGSPRPHVVLLVWDTCRGDRVSVNGCARPTTPALAAFAREGVVFRDCAAPAPVTPSSHASLFTGLLPRRHGLGQERGARVRPGLPLLAETLAAAGYATVAITENPHVSPVTGLSAGFEVLVPAHERVAPTVSPAAERVEAWLASRAAGGGDGRPVFLYVNLMATHLRYTFDGEAVAEVRGPEAAEGARRAAAAVTEEAANEHSLGIREVDPAHLPGLAAAYDAAVRFDDRTTERLLRLLRGAGLLDGAFVAVTGDHGESLGEGGRIGHLLGAVAELLHVPLVVRWPGRLDGGRVEEGAVRLQDLYPTILEAAGVPVPPGCGGDARSLAERPLVPRIQIAEYGPLADLVEVLWGREELAPPEAVRRLRRSWLSVRDPAGPAGNGRYLAVRAHPPKGAPVLVEESLHDPAADPGEERNLLAGPGSPEALRAAAILREAGER
jgi:arylsulfatase A-like enzyme